MTILQKGFDLIYKNGYQATSVDDIIATTRVTKGAFYYHFKTKDEMGLAIIKEILDTPAVEQFTERFRNTGDPNKEIFSMIKHLLFEDPLLLPKHGCPVSNLAQEMTPWHKEFSAAIEKLSTKWRSIISSAIKEGIRSGYYKKRVHPQQVSDFVISGYWGIRNLGKIHDSTECYKGYLKELKNYLESLR